MASIGPSFFILGVVMVTVIAAQTSSSPDITVTTTESNDQNSSMTNTVSVSPLISEKTSYTTIAINNTADVTSEPGNRTTSINFTSTIATLTMKGNEGPESSKSTQSPMTTSTPLSASQSTLTTKGETTEHGKNTATDRTGIIILVVIIIVALGFGVACYFARKRGRRYSVDFNSRPDEANIPLSTIPSEMPPDNAPQNGLQTFQSIETNAKESQEPEAKPLVQEEQKAEADKSVVDPSAESADSSGDKPKEDVAEQSPPAPVGPNPEEKTDDEGIVSNKTSVESLKETNENNSNNADVTQKKDWKFTNVFWEVSLDNPV
ncbi:serine-rich adhesin for platelets [Thunnus thynnus]|uniref:serine-rich adhesin for platelets n=1 Tax=Thunnus thynnus TaxID=8237 RepID=UPI0035286ACD